MTVARVKLLIAKDVFTDDEFKAQLSTERANYLAVLKRLQLDIETINVRKFYTG